MHWSHIDLFLLVYVVSKFDKSDQLVVYAFRLLNKIKQNYNTIEKKALAMGFALHKFRHYLLGNKFVIM
jgi:hypothetical protein